MMPFRELGFNEGSVRSGHFTLTGNKSVSHLNESGELMDFLKEQQARVVLRGDRIEIELGKGHNATAQPFQGRHPYLLRQYHDHYNYGVGVTDKSVILNRDGHIVVIARDVFNSPRLLQGRAETSLETSRL